MASRRLNKQRRETIRRLGAPGVKTQELALRALARGIRAVRESQQLTQEEAAEKCSIGVRHLQALESADTNATVLTIARVAEGLGVNFDQVFQWNTKSTSDKTAKRSKVPREGTLARKILLHLLRARDGMKRSDLTKAFTGHSPDSVGTTTSRLVRNGLVRRDGTQRNPTYSAALADLKGLAGGETLIAEAKRQR